MAGVTIFKAGVTFLKFVMAQTGAREELARYALPSSQLRVATFCAEPVSAEVQQFGMKYVTPHYINSYWGTEHGGMVLSCPYADAEHQPLIGDARVYPFSWIAADVWDSESSGAPCSTTGNGEMVITAAWPYMARTLWGDVEHFGQPGWRGDVQRFQQVYFSRFPQAPSAFCQGDAARAGPQGSFYMLGRSDEVMNINGIRVGTGELEAAILLDKLLPESPVANAMCTSMPHAISGETPVVFVMLMAGEILTPSVVERLKGHVRDAIGSHAVPDAILAVRAFPETLTGKYVRRMVNALLRDAPPGELTVLRNPACIDHIREAGRIPTPACTLPTCHFYLHCHPNPYPHLKVIKAWKESPSPGSPTLMVAEKASRNTALDSIASSLGDMLGGDPRGQPGWERIPFMKLGVTSLLVSHAMRQLSSTFGQELAPLLMFEHPTPVALVDHLLELELYHNGLSSESISRAVVGTALNCKANICIVGQSFRLPGDVHSDAELWDLCCCKLSGIQTIPKDRWALSEWFDSDRLAPGKHWTSRAGFLARSDVERFDNIFFDISAAEVLL